MQSEEKKSILQRITVVNKYKHEATSDDVYIGRGSFFGNPYSHLPSEHKDIASCESREEALELFKAYFDDITSSCGCKHKGFKNTIRKMVVKLKLGQEINLVCYCKPKACHGDIIRNYILTQI